MTDVKPGAEFPITSMARYAEKFGATIPTPYYGEMIVAGPLAESIRRSLARHQRVVVDGIPWADDPWPRHFPLWPALDPIGRIVDRLRWRYRAYWLLGRNRVTMAWHVLRHGWLADEDYDE